MVTTVQLNPQTSSKDLQHDLAADGVTLQRSTIQCTLHKEMLYGRVMRQKPFLRTCHKQSHLRFAKADLDKPASFWKLVEEEHSIPRQTLATHSKMW